MGIIRVALKLEMQLASPRIKRSEGHRARLSFVLRTEETDVVRNVQKK